jgi:eukaryotic-like serine/threonine-protein kinase
MAALPTRTSLSGCKSMRHTYTVLPPSPPPPRGDETPDSGYDEMMSSPRYREEFLLGMGGMAEVWKAKGPQGAVAIKRLLPHAARNPSIAAAFEREGRLLSRISHPNVIGIHEVTRDDQGTYLVLEYIEGADLTGIGGAIVPTRIALRIIRDLLRALMGVHSLCDEQGRSLGLIHRDLSLANLLVDIDGRVKLTDFGLARAVSGSQAATTGQSIKGTLAYLAPEQARGAPVDARTDLFAAGAILYEMLAGAPIYNDDDARIALARARAGDVASLASARPETPHAIVEFVDRALAAEPADRFPNAEIMLRELERVAAMSGGFASDHDMVAWARSYMLAVPRHQPARPAAQTAVIRKQRPVLYGLAIGLVMLMLFVVVRLSLRREARPSDATLAAGSAEAPSVVTLDPAPVSAVSPTPTSTSAGTKPREAEDRPVRKTRQGSATASSGASHARDDRSTSEVTKEKCILDIGSEPAFAYVAIDGVKVGATPIFGREVTPGAHRIQVWRDGLGSKTFTVEIRPGDRITRVVKLP